jgi:hypothetical protein
MLPWWIYLARHSGEAIRKDSCSHKGRRRDCTDFHVWKAVGVSARDSERREGALVERRGKDPMFALESLEPTRRLYLE